MQQCKARRKRKEKFMLLTNFENKETPLIKIAIQASGLTHYSFGEAYDMAGGLVEKHTGLYLDDIYSNSKEGKRAIHLFFQSNLLITERLLQLGKEKGI